MYSRKELNPLLKPEEGGNISSDKSFTNIGKKIKQTEPEGDPAADFLDVLVQASSPFCVLVLELGRDDTAHKHCLEPRTNAEPQTPESDPYNNRYWFGLIGLVWFGFFFTKTSHLQGNKKNERNNKNKKKLLKHGLILTWL